MKISLTTKCERRVTQNKDRISISLRSLFSKEKRSSYSCNEHTLSFFKLLKTY